MSDTISFFRMEGITELCTNFLSLILLQHLRWGSKNIQFHQVMDQLKVLNIEEFC